MVSTSEGSIDEDTPMKPEGEFDLDKMTLRVQNLFRFKHFYDQMDFIQSKLAITKSITELTNPSGNCSLIENRSRKAKDLRMLSCILQQRAM